MDVVSLVAFVSAATVVVPDPFVSAVVAVLYAVSVCICHFSFFAALLRLFLLLMFLSLLNLLICFFIVVVYVFDA